MALVDPAVVVPDEATAEAGSADACHLEQAAADPHRHRTGPAVSSGDLSVRHRRRAGPSLTAQRE
ncbi:hypothetical protein OG271_23460 [Micromonospora rifamycinica]|uniref:hypothetical protein n=1 Tax=Micromonospora rifamycinica TaxID=291594 RepID=UPI002E2E316B|nr:hypothetical protein [Micromonospora rifamycinica]